MPGPSPKHASVKARRNKASTRATLPDVDDDDIEIPPLPKHYEYYVDPHTNQRKRVETPWNEMAVEWWNDIWPSPMAQEWHSSDIHGLYRVLRLVDDYWCATSLGERLKAAGEIRLSAIPYGLSPLDRRRLEWTLENTKKAQRENLRAEQQVCAPTATTPTPPADDDIRLRVV
jgi:hypothetical protein